ncbi:hypothetical protein HS088_TW15G00955 [Tripterygium wilfordii]|uniref:DUF7912 domain-containing protein n=1 Tax=Tripterygium wilfordii TaxID=458696 RepID=A0A7J7CN37_TRIWF|nr:uncharacterized protein LOC120016298 [Tripterygium wilfordii]KAF5735449.1 hypothetical protein HS088_TW15G00955 [Tripterygium wilfordii]
MDLVSTSCFKLPGFSLPPRITAGSSSYSLSPCKFFFFCPISRASFSHIPNKCSRIYAKKRKLEPDMVLEQTIVEEVFKDDEDADEVLLDDFENDELLEDDDGDFEDEYLSSEGELYVGDGGEGGGISLAGTWWDKEALAIAEEVALSFNGDLGIYAFRTLSNSIIKVRIEKLSNRSGSPNMEDIEAFSKSYRARLNDAELTKSVPTDLSLEVSSPGLERIVRIPQDLDRFKDRHMYVKYVSEVTTTGSPLESDGVLRLVSFDVENKCCTWGLADIKVNREKAGKGRPLNKKQREWRLDTTFDSLRLVRLYSEF